MTKPLFVDGYAKPGFIGGPLFLYYTQILGANAAYVSTALGLALLLYAVSNLSVGAFSDRLKSKLVRRHPQIDVALELIRVFLNRKIIISLLRIVLQMIIILIIVIKVITGKLNEKTDIELLGVLCIICWCIGS